MGCLAFIWCVNNDRHSRIPTSHGLEGSRDSYKLHYYENMIDQLMKTVRIILPLFPPPLFFDLLCSMIYSLRVIQHHLKNKLAIRHLRMLHRKL